MAAAGQHAGTSWPHLTQHECENSAAANISAEAKYQNLRQADMDTRVRLPPLYTDPLQRLISFTQAISSYRHELSKTDPRVCIWYQADTAVGKVPIRTQVNKPKVPDGAIWFVDWEVMANEDKAQFWLYQLHVWHAYGRHHALSNATLNFYWILQEAESR
jgi:hypothetical protein